MAQPRPSPLSEEVPEDELLNHNPSSCPPPGSAPAKTGFPSVSPPLLALPQPTAEAAQCSLKKWSSHRRAQRPRLAGSDANGWSMSSGDKQRGGRKGTCSSSLSNHTSICSPAATSCSRSTCLWAEASILQRAQHLSKPTLTHGISRIRGRLSWDPTLSKGDAKRGSTLPALLSRAGARGGAGRNPHTLPQDHRDVSGNLLAHNQQEALCFPKG